MEPIRAILLPSAVLPADLAYKALIEALGPGVHAVAKDLELYRDDEPPAGWSLDAEVDGILREADARGCRAFPHRHHFDPPHRAEPERLAEGLKRHWASADGATSGEVADTPRADARTVP